MSSGIENREVIKDPTVALGTKDKMLATLKATPKHRSKTENLPTPITSPAARTMAIASLGEAFRLIQIHLQSYQPTGMFEPFDISTRMAEIQYVNIPEFIENIFKELLLPGNEHLVVLDTVRKHLANLFKKFPDHLLPLTSLEPELSNFAYCVILIATKDYKLKHLFTNPYPELSYSDYDMPLEELVKLNEQDAGLLLATALTQAPAQATVVSDTPVSIGQPFLPLANQTKRQSINTPALVSSGALLLASAAVLVLHTRSEQPRSTVTRTQPPVEPTYTNTVLPPPSPIPEIPPSPQPIQPRIVSVHSSFFFGTQSSLERGVRTALLSGTTALAHCITRPNTDPRHLAYGLTAPITAFIRHSGWTVGSPRHPRGITISWTDDSQCNDFKVTGWEQRDNSLDRVTVQAEVRVTIPAPIATIVNNRALYHRLPPLAQ